MVLVSTTHFFAPPELVCELYGIEKDGMFSTAQLTSLQWPAVLPLCNDTSVMSSASG
ncbi:8649_t:CDS:2 [Funneliformis geosporum]|uniref:8649_t:CDS:1 n=1 Tax=Funneliformis geosporum TaxID=1117311 RepID=A0A9W4SCM2_9GLOM|nr:8649_t:CDS:2 [Funneliformis geosporum]